ncbi:MAB_1171c family putative transporter [Actinoplanes sp. NPDC049681]|uniref:MAB_1171c family putative transporter n=1 Tax=Actinoplanes sp. NPDC049681 TaxID=3363905 RepID=UPI00379C31D7
MTAQQTIRLVLLVVSWAALIVRSRAVLSARQRPMWLALLALAVEIALLQRPVAAVVTHSSGVPNLDVFVGGFCHVAMITILWTVASTSPSGPPSRRGSRFRLWFTTLTVIAMLISEVCSTLLAEPTRQRALPMAVGRSIITVGWLAYLLFIAVVSVDCTWRLWRHHRATSFGALRLAIALLCVGTTASAVYVVGRIFTIMDGARPGSPSALLVMCASSTYFLCYVFGCAIVVLAPIVAGMRAWWQRCRLYRLWRSLTEAVPGVVLEESPSIYRDVLRMRRNAVRLQRRVIEIRDAAITLREWISPEQFATVTAEVAGSGASGMAASATVTARCLALGRKAKRAGEARSIDVPDIATSGGEDLDSELRWLMAVRDAYRDATRRLP